MATVNVSRKSNADMLEALQAFYPDLSVFSWNPDGTAVVTTTLSVMPDNEKDDIVQYIAGPSAWQAA